MKRNSSWPSTMNNVSTKPLINSYGNFLRYISKYNIVVSPLTRRYVLQLYLDRHKIR
jgi:hypothetical protein